MSLEAIQLAREAAQHLPQPALAHVLLLLATYADKDCGRIFPSVRTLCLQTGMTERYMRTILGQLRTLGWLTVQAPSVGQTATMYRITPAFPSTPALEDTPASQSSPPLLPRAETPAPGSTRPLLSSAPNLSGKVHRTSGARAPASENARATLDPRPGPRPVSDHPLFQNGSGPKSLAELDQLLHTTRKR